MTIFHVPANRASALGALLALLLTTPPASAQAPAGVISTVAGGYTGDGGRAISAVLHNPNGVVVAPGGVVYIADSDSHRVRRVDSSGLITTVAGSGNSGFGGDGGLATSAQLWSPQGLAVGPDGSLYIADKFNHRIRRVGPDGKISTVAGIGVYGSNGDGGLATSAQLYAPVGVAAGPDGSLYIADMNNHRIRRVTKDGKISTFAGTGARGFNGDNRAAIAAQLASPQGIAVDQDGVVYIADSDNQRIRRVGLDGQIATVAGSGVGGGDGDGGPAVSAQLNVPSGVAVGPDGTLYIADENNARIRRVGSDGNIGTVAGGGDLDDGNPATLALLDSPIDVAIASDGTLYIAEAARIRIVGADRTISTLAGRGLDTLGDFGTATSAQLAEPSSVAIGPDGAIYLADSASHRVRRVGTDGVISTVAGTGAIGYSGDGAAAVNARLNSPDGVAVGADGSVFIADTGNQAIRRVGPDGTIATAAGNGTYGYSGDGGAATNAQLQYPSGVAVVADGTLYIADTFNHRVRRVGPDGNISTVAGTGKAGFSGDGGAASSAQLAFPRGVAVGANGNLYIADTNNHRIRVVTPNGKITTFAGTGLAGFGGDGSAATSSSLWLPGGVATGVDGSVYIADTYNERIRRVGSDGKMSTVAGTGGGGFGGDGGLAIAARISVPNSVAAGQDGSIYIADNGNSRVRRVAAVALGGSILSIVSGNSQVASPGAGFQPLVVKVSSASGSGVSGVSVAFAVKSGTGSVSNPSVTTDSNGLAQVSAVAGGIPGALSIGATAGTSSVIFGLTVSAPALPTLTSSISQVNLTSVSGGAAPPPLQIPIGSDGAPISFTARSSASWLQANPTQATTPVVLNVTVNPASLAPGTYQATITIDSGGASNSPLQIPVVFVLGLPSNTKITLTTVPAGLSVIVDGATVLTPRDFSWTPGSSHTLDVPTPQGSGSTRYVFGQWSQGGPQSQTINAPAAATTYTATLATQYLLTTGINPVSGGSVTAVPTSTDGFYAASAQVKLTAAAATGYSFLNFSGDLATTANGQTVTMSGPKNITANFNLVKVSTKVTISSNPPGRTIVVDGIPITAPTDVTWDANSVHTIEAQSPQGVGSTRYGFDSWSNSGTASQSITTPSSSVTYTASFVTQYLVAAAANPANGGNVSLTPASGDGFYQQGTQVQLTATPQTGFTFSGFTGDLIGTTNPQKLTVSGPKSIVAAFTPVAPLNSDPPQLSLTATQGSNATGTLQITGGSPGQLVTATVDKPWLRVNPSRGVVPFGVNVVAASADLSPESYTGMVTIGGTKTVPVSFLVNPQPPTAKLVSSVLATGLQFTATLGATAAPAAQSIGISSSDGSTLNYTASVTYSQGVQNWAVISPSSGQTPVSAIVTVLPSLLSQAGTYTAQVVFKAGNGSPDVSIPIALNYVVPQAPQFDVTVQELKLDTVGDVKTSSIVVSSLAAGPQPITVAAKTDDGNNWLKASPASASATGDQAAVLQVTADPKGLAPNTYTGTVQIFGSNQQQSKTVKVIFAVNTTPGTKSLTSAFTSLTLRVGSGFGFYPDEPMDLIAYGTLPVNWTAQTDSPWMTVTPSSGVLQPGSTQGSPTITFDVSKLQPNSNKGTITIKSDSAGGDLLIPVEMQKAGPGVPVNRLTPNGLVLVPPFNVAADPLYYASSPTTKLTIQGPPWVIVQDIPNEGLYAGQTHRLHITINASLLPVGTPQVGLITVQEPNGLFAPLALLAYVPRSTSNVSARTGSAAAAGCTPTKYIPLATSFANSFDVNGGAARSMEIVLIDDCGNPVTSGVTGGALGNGDPQLNLRALGDGRWKATWNPTTPNSYVPVNILAADPDNGIGTTAPVTAISSVTGAPTGAVLDKAQPFETEAGVRLPALAPNMQFRIKGQNFLNPDGSVPLVLIGGRPVQVVNATNTQMVVLTPADLTVNVQMQLVIQRVDGTSVPEGVIVAPVWPVVARSGASRNEAIVTGLGKEPGESLVVDGGRVVSVERVGPGLWKVVGAGSMEGVRLRVGAR